MRILAAALVSLGLGLFIAVADENKPLPPQAVRAKRLKELEKRFDEEAAQLQIRYERAKTPKEREAVQTEARELTRLISDKLAALIADDPTDAVAVEALAVLVQKTAVGAGREVEQALARVAEHQADSPRVKDLLPLAGRQGPAGLKFLEAVATRAAAADTRGLALFWLGAALAEEADFVEDPARQEEAIARAAKYLERAAQEAPDAPIGTSTIAKQAAAELAGLKRAVALLVGKPAPDIESRTLDGQPARLSALKGKVVLLDFWATYCGPCRAMIPHERQLVKRMAGRPFELVSVSGDADKETLEQFLAREPMPWTHWWKDGGRDAAFDVYRAYSFPTVYLIDHAGIIRARWKYAPEPAELDKWVEQLVKEAEKK